MEQQVLDTIHHVIKHVWINEISKDYEASFLLKEDTLKNAFYYHIRRHLQDDFLKEHNLAIFTEFCLPHTKQRVDLAIVEISPDVEGKYLSDCVVNIISVIEMKHKNASVPDIVFQNDVNKIIGYTKSIPFTDTRYYLAFIREFFFWPEEVGGWLENSEQLYPVGRITELLSYGCLKEDQMIWRVLEH